jgi:hypothetical protein
MSFGDFLWPGLGILLVLWFLVGWITTRLENARAKRKPDELGAVVSSGICCGVWVIPAVTRIPNRRGLTAIVALRKCLGTSEASLQREFLASGHAMSASIVSIVAPQHVVAFSLHFCLSCRS